MNKAEADLKRKAEALENNQKDEADAKLRQRLLEDLSILEFQFHDLEDKMESALMAMQEVCNVFQKQADDYALIIGDLKTMETGVTSDDIDVRQMSITDSIDEAVNKFTEV